MLAHRLRHRVAFQRQTVTQNPDTGAQVLAWVDLVISGVTYTNVPAEVLTGPGKERTASDSVQGELAARINLRWFPGLKQSMRVIWEGEPYNISSIETDVTARREYRLRCTAGVNDGQ